MLKNLLDMLCEKANCVYVSDLTQDKYRQAVAAAAKELMKQDVDDSQWIAAAEYVSLGEVKVKTAQAAKDYFNTL